MGAVTGAAFGGMAGYANTANWGLAKTVAGQALVGGTTARIQGGSFQSGMLSAGFLAWAAPQIERVKLASEFLSRVGRTMAAAVVGGTASELGGGKFENGAKTFGFLRTLTEAADYYQTSVGRPANPMPGENRAESTYEWDENGRQLRDSWNLNVIANNKPLDGAWYAPTNFFKQGGMLSRMMNVIPIMNAIGGLHDYLFNSGKLDWNLYKNVGSMLPSAAISVGAVMGNYTQGWDSNSGVMFYVASPRNQ